MSNQRKIQKRPTGLSVSERQASDPIRTHVRKILQAEEQENRAIEARIGKIEADGGRIIDAGQTCGDAWEVTDYRTGELIVSGDGGLDGYAKAAERLDADNKWHLSDHIYSDDPPEPSPTKGVPPTLADALRDWVGALGTSHEEIAEVAGWDVDKVASCLRSPHTR
jgi:hypothetical protein